MQSWLVMLQDLTAQGRRFARVRVVSMSLTDYSRFGVWCAQLTNGAGEDIRYLTRDQAQSEGLPAHDYWLFDSRTLVQLHLGWRGSLPWWRAHRGSSRDRAAQLLA